jgi:hypothetical protein
MPIDALSHAIGITELEWREIEQGRKPLTTDCLQQLPLALGVPITHLANEYAQAHMKRFCETAEIPELPCFVRVTNF